MRANPLTNFNSEVLNVLRFLYTLWYKYLLRRPPSQSLVFTVSMMLLRGS